MRIKLPENCLRNSYATYAQTFRSLGDVAKAVGDQEATVKRYYIETLEPNVGHEWFKVLPRMLDRGPWKSGPRKLTAEVGTLIRPGSLAPHL